MDVMTLTFVKLLFGIAGSSALLLFYLKDRTQRFVLFWLVASLSLVLNAGLMIIYFFNPNWPYWFLPAGANIATVSIHIFTLAAIYEQTNRKHKYQWYLGALLVCYALNNTEFAQLSSINRLLINFPIVVALNVLAIKQLLSQSKDQLSKVFYVFAGICGFNALHMSVSIVMALAVTLGLVQELNFGLIISLNSYGLTAFSFLTLGACLHLLYTKSSLELQADLERDPLTGAFNRRSMENKLEIEFDRCSRTGAPLSVVMLDIDFFKKVNDTLGHVSGDLAIKHVAEVARNQLRAYDALYRYGGEEFLICLPDTNSIDAFSMAERVRKEVERSTIENLPDLRLTISLGIATSAGNSDCKHDWKQLVEDADKALYQSKQQGRNRVSEFEPAMA